jgi:hypothetical protein
MDGYDQPAPLLPPDSNGTQSWDPNGPYGQLVDGMDPWGRTIGELARSDMPPMHGWMPMGDGTAMPVYDTSSAQARSRTSARKVSAAAALLLLL